MQSAFLVKHISRGSFEFLFLVSGADRFGNLTTQVDRLKVEGF